MPVSLWSMCSQVPRLTLSHRSIWSLGFSAARRFFLALPIISPSWEVGGGYENLNCGLYLRTLLTTFPLPITLWGASGHRSDQTDLFISTRSLSQQADRIFLPPSMTPTAYHIFWSKMQMCTSRPGREGTWWKRERRVVGKSKWGGKSELPSRLWSELSSKQRAHRAWVLSSLHSPAAETTHFHPDRNSAIQ